MTSRRDQCLLWWVLQHATYYVRFHSCSQISLVQIPKTGRNRHVPIQSKIMHFCQFVCLCIDYLWFNRDDISHYVFFMMLPLQCQLKKNASAEIRTHDNQNNGQILHKSKMAAIEQISAKMFGFCDVLYAVWWQNWHSATFVALPSILLDLKQKKKITVGSSPIETSFLHHKSQTFWQISALWRPSWDFSFLETFPWANFVQLLICCSPHPIV